MKWKFEKFTDDMLIYEMCPKCNYRHRVGNRNEAGEWTIEYGYNYCPICGEYLKNENEEVEVIWNERSVFDL